MPCNFLKKLLLKEVKGGRGLVKCSPLKVPQWQRGMGPVGRSRGGFSRAKYCGTITPQPARAPFNMSTGGNKRQRKIYRYCNWLYYFVNVSFTKHLPLMITFLGGFFFFILWNSYDHTLKSWEWGRKGGAGIMSPHSSVSVDVSHGCKVTVISRDEKWHRTTNVSAVNIVQLKQNSPALRSLPDSTGVLS